MSIYFVLGRKVYEKGPRLSSFSVYWKNARRVFMRGHLIRWMKFISIGGQKINLYAVLSRSVYNWTEQT